MTQEQRVQLRDDLLTVRERMSDPHRVVLDPDNMFETADGRDFWWRHRVEEQPPRACFSGWVFIAAYSDPDREERMADLLEVTWHGMSERGSSCLTSALRQGEHLAVVDAALEEAEQAVRFGERLPVPVAS